MTTTSPGAPPSRLPLVIAGVALAVAIVLPLCVWTFAKTDPTFDGIPFFFWYQFLLVIVSVVLTTVAYRLTLRHEAARRAYEESLRSAGPEGTR